MPDYKKRFIKEYKEILERTCKLGVMLKKYEDKELDFVPDTPLVLLQAQYHAMLAYLYILERRAVIENIKL